MTTTSSTWPAPEGADDDAAPPLIGPGQAAGLWVMLACVSAVAASAWTVAAGAWGAAAEGRFALCLAAGVAAVAAVFDAGTGRIPNALTYTAALAGVLIASIATWAEASTWSAVATWLASPGLTGSLQGAAVCGAIALVCLATAGMGGGDAKLMIAVGALLGVEPALSVLGFTLAIAAGFALVNLAGAGRLNAALRLTAMHALSVMLTRRGLVTPGVEASKLPLAVPMLFGLIASAFVDLTAVAEAWR